METMKLTNGNTITFLQLKNVAGRKKLTALGFEKAGNGGYMKNGELLAHYNRLMKCWLIDQNYDQAIFIV